MQIRVSYLWRSPALVWSGAWMIFVSAGLSLVWADLPPDAVVYLLPPLAGAVPLLLILSAGLESGPGRSIRGDVDHLLALKRQGGLPPAGRPMRRGSPSGGGSRASVVEISTAPDEVLDRLLALKRRETGLGQVRSN